MALLVCTVVGAQHTFSIVAVDSLTGEIGSAGATCGDSIIWPGTPGAILISNVIPGVGAIHTQSYHHVANQANARDRMLLGDNPQEIIDWLQVNDVNDEPTLRQYGVVDYNGGHPRSAAFTGEDCLDFKNHILGPNYAIQGNILLGQQILDSMESFFIRTEGCLSDRLMATMQGANVVGADMRCMSEGTSSLSAFIRVAKPDDHPDFLYLDINIAGTAPGVEPIDELQSAYDTWRINTQDSCTFTTSTSDPELATSSVLVYPIPATSVVNIKQDRGHVLRVVVFDILGHQVIEHWPHLIDGVYQVPMDALSDGVYLISIYLTNNEVLTRKVVLSAERN